MHSLVLIILAFTAALLLLVPWVLIVSVPVVVLVLVAGALVIQGVALVKRWATPTLKSARVRLGLASRRRPPRSHANHQNIPWSRA